KTEDDTQFDHGFETFDQSFQAKNATKTLNRIQTIGTELQRFFIVEETGLQSRRSNRYEKGDPEDRSEHEKHLFDSKPTCRRPISSTTPSRNQAFTVRQLNNAVHLLKEKSTQQPNHGKRGKHHKHGTELPRLRDLAALAKIFASLRGRFLCAFALIR